MSADTPLCTAIREAWPRRWRCTNKATKKSGYTYCSKCTPRPRCGSDGVRRYHRPDCIGCSAQCCQDRSLCGPDCWARPEGDMHNLFNVLSGELFGAGA